MRQAKTHTLIGLIATVIVVLAVMLLPACQGAEPANQPSSSSSERASVSQGYSSYIIDINKLRNGYYEQDGVSPDLRGTMPYEAAINAYKAIRRIEKKTATLALVAIEPTRLYKPLSWNIDEAQLVGRQGTTALWGTCGQCCIANTLNLVTGSDFTEADIVSFTLDQGLCVPETGGMTLDDIANAYVKLLPRGRMDVFGYGGDYAPTIEGLAARLEYGMILNVSVYGEMMREGGHTGEGEVSGTHWIVLHSVDRAADGSVAGFGIIDSASSITYLTAQELSDIYYGHDGTTITDPSCVQIYGREP